MSRNIISIITMFNSIEISNRFWNTFRFPIMVFKNIFIAIVCWFKIKFNKSILLINDFIKHNY